MGHKPRRTPEAPHFSAACSFCYNEQASGDLIIGPRVSICFDCVEHARNHVGHIRVERLLTKHADPEADDA